MKVGRSHVAQLLAANERDAAEALAQLSSVWSTRARLSETGELTGLSAAETAAHLALWYFGEAGNGGHVQYFMNPMGAFADATVASLERLGLTQAAQILSHATQVFPDGRVPKDRALRLAKMESLGPHDLAVLRHSDSALSAIARQVDGQILRYLHQHQDEVLTAEQL